MENNTIITETVNNALRILQKREHIFLQGIILLTALTYSRLGGFDITTYDDTIYYSYCASLAELSFPQAIWHLLVDVVNYNWHPITTISFYFLDYYIFDLDSGASHLINVFIHLVNIILVYQILIKLRFSPATALIAVFLFALHPLQVEAVAWIAERKGLLAAMLMLLSLKNYIDYKSLKLRSKYIFALLYFTLGMMSKASIVTFPVMLIIVSHYLYKTPLLPRSNGKINYTYLETLPFFFVSLIIGPVLVYIHYETGALGLMQHVDTLERFHNFVNSIRIYLIQIIIPDDFSIVYDYKYTIPLKLLIPSYLLLVGLLVSAIYSFFHHKRAFFIICWFFILLFPLSGLIQTGSHPHADRYMYTPSISIYTLIGMLLTWLFCYAKKTRVILLALLSVALSVSSYINILKWKNTITLFRDSVETIGDTYLAHASLTFYYLYFDHLDEGMKEYEIAQKLSFHKYEFYWSIVNNLYSRKHYDEAEKVAKDAIYALGKGVNAFRFFKVLARIQIEKHEYKLAQNNINICFTIKNDDAENYYLRGLLLQNMGDKKGAKTNFDIALKYNPKFSLVKDAIKDLESNPESYPQPNPVH